MKKLLSALAALTLASFLPATADTPVAGAGSDLKPDPKALFGHMDNGFRYIIYPNSEPPARFSIRLHIAAGSLHEEDDQRGLAHFLEHMVFNGSKNFSPDELIPRMQRLGIAFGAHANAYTSFDETVYMLDLPNLKDDTLDLTFTVMRDFADGALLAADEIEKERGVILSEKTSRDSVDYRMMVKQYGYLLPGSRIFNRLPIGTEEVIKKAPRQRFLDFYEHYYTPERMTLVLVGDFDAHEMEKRVRETFISLANPEKPGANPPADRAPAGHGLRTEIFTDPEISSDDLTLYTLRDYEQEADTAANRQAKLPLALAHSILSRRLEILAKKENTPFIDGSAGRFILFNQIETGYLSLTPAEGQWQAALSLLEQELRRALTHGFTKAELAEARANLLNHAEQAVKTAPSRESQTIASQLISAIGDARVFTTPETNLELTRQGLETITPEACHQAFKTFWDTPDLSLVLTTKKAGDEERQKLRSLFESSRETPVEAPVEATAGSFAYTDFGQPGTITADEKIADLGARQLTLSNQVRVNLKATDFEKNTIRLFARIGSGQLTMPKDSPGLDQFASAIFEAGGLGKHSADDLQRLLAGKNLSASFGVDTDAFVFSGRTTPDDLKLQLQLLCAYLSDPAYRPEAIRQYQKSLPPLYNELQHSLQGALIQARSHLHSGDYRFELPPLEKALSYTAADAQRWLDPQLKTAPIELTLVGDFDPEATLPLILETFGALPERAQEKPAYEEARRIPFPKTPASTDISFPSKIPNAAALVAWQIPGSRNDIKAARRFNLLAGILSDRLRAEIREKLGGSYSPRAAANSSFVLDFGYLQALAQVKPEESTKYTELITKIADELAREGLTQDELDRTRKPILSNLAKSLRENSYWLTTVLSSSQENPARLDWARERDADYASITVAELNELAAKHLAKDQALRYHLVPQTPEQ